MRNIKVDIDAVKIIFQKIHYSKFRIRFCTINDENTALKRIKLIYSLIVLSLRCLDVLFQRYTDGLPEVQIYFFERCSG
jgi:hypothetical protein